MIILSRCFKLWNYFYFFSLSLSLLLKKFVLTDFFFSAKLSDSIIIEFKHRKCITAILLFQFFKLSQSLLLSVMCWHRKTTTYANFYLNMETIRIIHIIILYFCVLFCTFFSPSHSSKINEKLRKKFCLERIKVWSAKSAEIPNVGFAHETTRNDADVLMIKHRAK